MLIDHLRCGPARDKLELGYKSLTMISMALSKLLMAFSNLFAFMLVLPKRMNKGATGFTRVARSRTSIAYELIARNYKNE